MFAPASCGCAVWQRQKARSFERPIDALRNAIPSTGVRTVLAPSVRVVGIIDDDKSAAGVDMSGKVPV